MQTGSAISKEQAGALYQTVSDLMVQSEARAVFVTDQGGNVLTSSHTMTESEVQTLAALAAGSFAATRELAAITGEGKFQAISHEGEKGGIYVRCIADSFLIIVIFEKTTTLGLVKLYSAKAAHRLVGVLTQISTQTISSARTEGVNFQLQNSDSVFGN